MLEYRSDAPKEIEYVLKCEWDYNEGEEGRNSVTNIKPVNLEDTGQKVVS